MTQIDGNLALPIPFDDVSLTPISEQIGSPRKFIVNFLSPWDTFQDNNRTDYTFWDKARRGKAKGLEVSGLFLRPLSDKVTSWVLGDPPLWQTGDETLTLDLNKWWQKSLSSIMRAYQEALDLGDCYIVFNGDSTLTVVSPNVVERLLDEENYQTVVGYRITTTYGNDLTSDSITIVDEYRMNARSRSISKFGGIPGKPVIYINPLKKIPVVHVSNKFGADELFGRALGDSILSVLIRYGDIFDAAAKGNIRQGRPTPVINRMGTEEQVEAFWMRYGRQEMSTQADGSQRTVYIIDFDPDMLITLGGDAQFKYEAPGSFSTDTLNLLEILFYLVIQNSEIPEFTLGGAVSASKASTDSQLEPFLRFIKRQRGMAMEWIQELADLFIAYTGSFKRSARNQEAVALWKPMSAMEGRLMLDTTIWLFAKQMIDPTLATWFTPLNISDPELVRQRAEDYWGAGYAQGNTANAAATIGDGTEIGGGANAAVPAVPASGGGDQNRFTKQENPIQPTERQMIELPSYLQEAFMRWQTENKNEVVKATA